MIIGVTGSFGAGKTTVANMFKKQGFRVINVDKSYSEIYRKNAPLKNKIKKEFGTLDRNKIKKIVFNNYNKLKKLNKITHPLIIKELKDQISTIIKKSNKKYSIFKKRNNKNLIINKKIKFIGKNNIGTDNVKIIIDAPLLIEAGAGGLVDKLIVVECSKKEQIKRILKKKKYIKKEINNILKSQMPLKEKIKKADFVIDNNKSIKNTSMQVKILANILQKP